MMARLCGLLRGAMVSAGVCHEPLMLLYMEIHVRARYCIWGYLGMQRYLKK